MAAGGAARWARSAAGTRARSRSETRGPGRRRLSGRCAKGSPEDGSLEAACAQPPADGQQERGGPRTPSPCSSHEADDKQPSKRLKCEKPDLAESELEGLTGGNGNLAPLGETPQTSDGDPCSKDPGDHDTVQQEEGEGAAGSSGDPQEKEHDASLEPHAVTSSAPSKMDHDENLHGYVCSEEESSCQSLLSDVSSSKEGDLPKKLMQLDNSALLGEDSNQPMPVDRFFGDVDLLQGIPAAALPGTMKSRREFRKLHFIAKEEEEEEEEDVV